MTVLAKSGIRKRVAEALKIVATGQGLSARDGETIDNALIDVLAILKHGSYADYDIDAIPDYVAIPLVKLVAATAADGVNAVNPDQYILKAQGAEREIRRLEFEPDKEDREEPELYI